MDRTPPTALTISRTASSRLAPEGMYRRPGTVAASARASSSFGPNTRRTIGKRRGSTWLRAERNEQRLDDDRAGQELEVVHADEQSLCSGVGEDRVKECRRLVEGRGTEVGVIRGPAARREHEVVLHQPCAAARDEERDVPRQLGVPDRTAERTSGPRQPPRARAR